MDRPMPNNVDEILKALEDGLRDFMDSDTYKTYLKAVSKFHDYSTNNILLITMQRPEASLVAGYSTWKHSFKRYVKKGEKGIRIIAPMPVTVEKEKEMVDERGNISKEKVMMTIPRFRTVTVFDVAQTDGEPLPKLDPKELNKDVEDYEVFVAALERSSRVPVNYVDIEGAAKGYYHTAKDEICIQKGMGQTQTVKTLIHEMAHSYLHNRNNGGILYPKKTKEVQAESIAFSVCTYFGIDTSEYTFPYVSAWSGEQDLKTLKSSMDTIRDTSSMLIHNIEDNYREIRRDLDATALSGDIHTFVEGYDHYGYKDSVDDTAQSTEELKKALMEGNTKSIQNILREYMRDEKDPDIRETISDLIDRTKTFQAEEEKTEKQKKGWER